MTKDKAAYLFPMLLLAYGASFELRNPGFLDYSEPANLFTRGLAPVEGE